MRYGLGDVGDSWHDTSPIGSSIFLGVLTLIALSAVLYVNGNTIVFSTGAGIVLGAGIAVLRFVVQTYFS
ncbi:hypothetical protein GCM10008985_39040 [Halococcus dombrowskii]|uniref:Uncharacterized protein n=1 Tax=Halococcus dombrowskii TaxID=179637 RepID=A0AAV3SMY6_HALDO